MLNRENFKKYMSELKELMEISDNMSNALKEISNMNMFYLEKPIQTILDMLKTIMEDTENIEYFIFELEWGTKAEKNSVTEIDGTPIPMFTLDDLYNELIRNKENV